MTKDELTDFYKKIPAELKTKYHNKNYKKHLMNIHFRALIVGGSGSGKTTLVLEMLSRMSKTFGLIILCCKDSDEPLYRMLKSKLDKDQLHIFENGEVPSPNDYKDYTEQGVIIFDDLVNEKEQRPIIEWFIRGRKAGRDNVGFSAMYLSQSYFKCPKTVRLQCNYILLKKLSSTRDLTNILDDFNLGVSKEVLFKLYRDATKDRKDFLMVDIDTTPELRFRHNFLDIYKLNLDEDKHGTSGSSDKEETKSGDP